MPVFRCLARCALAALLWGIALGPSGAETRAPAVVVSIAPLHSLAAAIMAGVGAPALLLDRQGSPHNVTLRPSQARALSRADLVVWIGPQFERFMVSILRDRRAAKMPARPTLTALTLPGLERLASRRQGVWTAGRAAGGATQAVDPHIWLSVGNARLIARALAGRLARIDPDHAADYADNLRILDAELRALDGQISKSLAGLHEAPFVLLHDAFQYFERAYDLRPVGALAARSAGGASAKRLHELKKIIAARAVRCLAADPFGSSALARTVAQSSALRLVALDPMGLSIPPGPGQYQSMMRANAQALASCLRLR
jgi:zinc transport system substrate-binding protein